MIDWLAERLGIATVVEESAGGRVTFSPAAARYVQQHARGTASDTLATALTGLVGNALDAAGQASLIAAARAGQPQEVVTEHGTRLWLGPGANERTLVCALAPRETTSPTPDQVAGVSHELSNALSAIAGWARLARQGHRVEEALELIEKSADNAWSTARNALSAFAEQPQAEPRTPIDLGAFAADIARLLEPKAARSRVQVRHHIDAHTPVMATRGALWTVVWNLAANAIEAMPDGGALDLRVSSKGDRVCLTVGDNGPGITPADQARAFEPYFTTKPQGAGIGLPMVRQTVEALGGQLSLRSEAGFGTRFEVLLPRATESPLPKRASGVFRSEPPPTRVLLVEDDVALREFVATTMDMLGMPLVAVGTGREALEQEGHFQVAVVDLLLPDCRGDELIASLRERDAIGAALLLSGAELPEDVSEQGRPDALVRKPFDIDQLLERLRELQRDPASASAGSH